MNRRNFMLVGASLFPAFAANSQGNGASLIVRLTYTGSGTVDESHKIYVALWDSPDFVKEGSAEPMAAKPISSKSGSVHFDDIQKNPVYVSMAYDPTGAWQADPRAARRLFSRPLCKTARSARSHTVEARQNDDNLRHARRFV